MTTKTTSIYRSFIGRRTATSAGIPYEPAQSPTLVVRNFQRSRTGQPNPKWMEQTRLDTNASTPFSGFDAAGSATLADGVMSWEESGGFPAVWALKEFKHEGYFEFLNIPSAYVDHPAPAISYVDADAIAIRNLHRKIDRLTHQFQGGVFVGQLAQAVKMVLSPAKSFRTKISDYVNAFAKRRRGVKQPEKLRKVLADTYLEYTFGWQPLLMDVREATKALQRFSDGDLERERFRVKGEVESQISQTQTATTVLVKNISFPYVLTNVGKRKIMVVYYGLFKAGLSDSSAASSVSDRLIGLSGFDFASFLPTLWELMPWSFVIDYFTNIGDLISAYTHVTSQVKWITRVNIAHTLIDVRGNPDAKGALDWIAAAVPQSRKRKAEAVITRQKSSIRTVSRVVAEVPFPVFRFELPQVDSQKWLNLAALALGARPRSLRKG